MSEPSAFLQHVKRIRLGWVRTCSLLLYLLGWSIWLACSSLPPTLPPLPARPSPHSDPPYDLHPTPITFSSPSFPFLSNSTSPSSLSMAIDGYNVDLRGKTAFIAGVADANGYGWAITKHLAEAGAKVIVGTWPPVLGIFKATLDSGKLAEDLKTSTGESWEIAKIYPLDATFDRPEDVPEAVKTNKRYASLGGYTISEVRGGGAVEGRGGFLPRLPGGAVDGGDFRGMWTK